MEQASQKRKVKKKKQKKKSKWKILLFLGLVIMILFIFRIRSLEIEGNQIVENSRIEEIINLKNAHGSSILLLFFNRNIDFSEESYINDIKIKMLLPWKIHVLVKEESAKISIKNNKEYLICTQNGKLLETTQKKPKNMPVLEGLTINVATLGQSIEVQEKKNYEHLLQLAELFENNQVYVEEITCDSEGEFSAEIKKVKIELGMWINMEDKVQAVKDVIAEISDLSGKLMLSEYDSSKDSIIFRKD